MRSAHPIDGPSCCVFGTLSDAAKSWDRQRRVIVKAEHLRGGGGGKSNPRGVVTNLAGDARALYEDVYCQRGDSENHIEEQQLGLFADRTSCPAFVANTFRVLLKSVRRLVVRLSAGYVWRELFVRVARRLQSRPRVESS